MHTSESVGKRAEQLLDESRAVITGASLGSAAFLFALTAAGTAYDLMSPDGSGTPLAICQTAAQYFLILAMLNGRGLLPETREKGFWSYLALGILTGIATLVGLVVFIVPGVILLIRWMPAYGLLLGQNKSVTESLSDSWKFTAPHFWPILLAALFPCLGYVAGLAVYLLPDFGIELPALIVAVLSNLLLYSASLFLTALGVSTYEALWNQDSEYRNVFA